MKRWALLTVALYIVFLSLLALPMFLATREKDNPAELVSVFYVWIAPVLILAQAVLLLVPLAVARERPVKRRGILASGIISGIVMAAMTLLFVSFIFLMILGENNDRWDWGGGWAFFAVLVGILWSVWGIVFWKGYSSQDPQAFISRMTHWLLRGSILELLVAVPSHIISRRRDECCAPPITLLGIAAGLSVAVLSFGPGVFFLFAKRIRDKKGRTA